MNTLVAGGNSPVAQSFIWIAEYADGSRLAEYDLLTKKHNKYYQIDKANTIRFGLLGMNIPLYFNTYDGQFALARNLFQFVYETDGKQYELTRQNTMYNDIITFKKAESGIYLNGGTFTNIMQYSFGYKAFAKIADARLNMKIICHVPVGNKVNFEVRLVSDSTLVGNLGIIKNGKLLNYIRAPLEPEIGGEVKWVIE